MWGTPPSKLVNKDTKMIEEVSSIVLNRYEKRNFGLSVPRCFDDIKSVDANFEITQSNRLQPLILFYEHNIVTEKVCVIFVHTNVKGLVYIDSQTAKSRGEKQAELFKNVFDFKDVTVYTDYSKK